MQFSGKITNSILAFLSRKGYGREQLFELTDVPFEFLKDPTSWLPSQVVEGLLRTAEREFGAKHPGFLVDMGHASSDLRAWGVLDSVLRMMKRPQDIFAQPQRFISYFVSPAPPIGNLRLTGETVSFDLPIAHSEYPATVAFLSAALEGLPRYWGQEPAQVVWQGTTVKIVWSEAQAAFLTESLTNPKPELVESLVRGVEMAQAQMEARDLEIARLEQELREVRSQLDKRKSTLEVNPHPVTSSERDVLQASLSEVRENVLRLTDYLTRSQQALTLAVAAHRTDPQVQAVLKRIDWETIRAQYPWLHLQIVEALNAANQLLETRASTRNPVGLGQIYINDVLDSVVARLQSGSPQGVAIRAKSFIERPLRVDGDRLHVAVLQVASHASREIERGEIEILAREDGDDVEIAVVERSHGERPEEADLPLLRGNLHYGDTAFDTAAELFAAQRGSLNIVRDSKGDRKFICRWPLRPLEEMQ